MFLCICPCVTESQSRRRSGDPLDAFHQFLLLTATEPDSISMPWQRAMATP